MINPQYGLTWDEFFMRQMGMMSYNYVFENDNSLLTFNERDYGVAIEMPLYALEKWTGLTSMHDVFLLRHFLCHLLFLSGAVCAFKLTRLLYDDLILALAAFLLVVLNPVMYGHSFFNSKDIPLLAMFLISFYASARAFRSYRTRDFILLGICIGILVNIRIAGFAMLGTTLGFLLIDLFSDRFRHKKLNWNILLQFFVVCISFCVCTVAIWPLIWHNTWDNLAMVFRQMAKFRWEGYVMMSGTIYNQNTIPWYYFFVYFGVTTPLVYVLMGAASILILLFSIIRKPADHFLNTPDRNNSIYLACMVAPIVLMYVLHSIIFDTWRHLFFLYAPFVMIIVKGLKVMGDTKLRKPVLGGLAAAFLFVIFFIGTNIPFHHVYYNSLVSHEKDALRKNYERDYWGASYKQAIEYVLDHDNSDTLKFCFNGEPGFNNFRAIEHKNKDKVQLTDIDHADYFFTTYRNHPDEFTEFKQKFYEIRVQNSEIHAVFKLK